MKIRNLFEKTDIHMPSGEWEYNKAHTFTDDAKWTEEAYNQFQNEEFVKRIKKVFDKLPFDVVVMPINEKHGFTWRQFRIYDSVRTKLPLLPSIIRGLWGLFSSDDNKLNLKKLDRKTAKFIKSKISGDKLTLIIASNYLVEMHTDVTPWMMAHGLSHAVEGDMKVNPSEMEASVFDFVNRLCTMTSEAYNLGWRDKLSGDFYKDYTTVQSNPPALPCELVTPYFTFRSARDNDMIHAGEFFNESFAQFMVTGKVSLNKTLPDTLDGKPLVKPEAVNVEVIQQFEKAMNREYENIISRLKGKIVLTYDE